MTKTAQLYRMVMENHLCPFGLKSKDLLEREGFDVEDNHLTTREETDNFMAEHNVETTPQTWIDAQRIGGYDALSEHFGQDVKGEDETSYQPVIAIFAVALLMALATSWAAYGSLLTVRGFEWFIAISLCFLAAWVRLRYWGKSTYWGDWYLGQGWFLWFGIWFLLISNFGHWGYSYRSNRRYSSLLQKGAIDILNERYARGEIHREEYGRMKLEISTAGNTPVRSNRDHEFICSLENAA